MKHAQPKDHCQIFAADYNEVAGALENCKNTQNPSEKLSDITSEMSRLGLPKDYIESYVKRLGSPKVIELLGQFGRGESTDSEIWVKVARVLVHLDSEDANNQKLVNKLCETLIRVSYDSEEVINALDLTYNVCTLFSQYGSIKQKAILHLLDIMDFNEDHRDIYPINISMQELIEPNLFEFVTKYAQKSPSSEEDFLEAMLVHLGVVHADLLTRREKERLLFPQQTRIEDAAQKTLKRLSIGEYISKNTDVINEFLEMRKSGAQETVSNKTGTIELIHMGSKGVDSLKEKDELIGMLIFGVNGSRDQEKQVKYRRLLQERFIGIDSGKALEQWKKVKAGVLNDLIEACKTLDIENQPSIDGVLSVFKRGIERMPKDEGKELNQIYWKINALLKEGADSKLLAYTVHCKDNIINVEAARTSACTFIDNPIGSYSMFNYALDPAIVLINYSIVKDQHINTIDVSAMPVYGIAICTLGRINSERKSGTMLFVDSVEGGIDFREITTGRELHVAGAIVKKAAEIGVDYVDFYTNVFPGTYSKLFVDSLEGIEEEIANVSFAINREQYLDSIRREKTGSDKSVTASLKIIDIRKGIEGALRT